MNTTSAVLPIAVQLYTLRTLQEDLAATLGRVAGVGFTAVETIGDHGMAADALRALLDQHSLQVIATHLPLERLRDELPAAIAFNKAIGNDTLVAPYIPALIEERDRAGYIAVGRLLGEIGRRCRDAGMRLLYHNHHWELRPIGGRLGLEWLLEAAGSDALDLELDLAWVAAAGLDPAVLLAQYAGHCPRVHVKDLARVGERPDDAVIDGVVMADVGAGVLEWPQVLAAARDAGTEWYIVEHDNPRDPIASVGCSFAYLHKLLPEVLLARS
jgi:sugar phosphate isomerase/epimerase